MNRRVRALAAVTVVTLLLVVAVPTAFPGIPSPWSAGEEALRALLPAFLASFQGAVDLGPLAPAPMTVGVALASPDPSGADQAIQQMYTPGSPTFGHYLSPEQFRATYSPTPAQVAAVEQYYAGYGLTFHPSADRLMLGMTGSSTAIDSAFHTQLHQYRLADGRTVFGPQTAVTVPSSLPVVALTGFTNATGGIQPLYHGAPILAPALTTHRASASSASASPGITCSSGSTACMWWGQYGMTSLENSGKDGAGTTVGIVDAYDSGFTQTQAASSVASNAASNGLPTPTIHFLYPSRTTGNLNSSPSSGWGGETQLDIGTVDDMAPATTIDLTFATDSELSVYQAVDYLVAFNLTDTISMSWGEADVGIMQGGPTPCMPYYSCNATWDGSYSFLHPVFQEAVMEGITPFAAAGDCGAADGTLTVSSDYPSSDPYVVGVGGTSLNGSGTTWAGGTAWNGNGTGCTANTGGGGGAWSPFPRPWWQHGWNILNNGLRGDPDVAADSSGGTSQSTPLWAGMVAVADQMHGRGLGLITPSLYTIYRSSAYNTSFHDIVVGNNGYPAGRGYDLCTGLGDPIGSVLFPALAGFSPTPSSISVGLTASPQSGPAGTTVTFTATASGGRAPYTYDFVPGLDLGQWTGHTSTLKYTYSTAGAYAAQVEVWDANGNWSQSLSLMVTIGGIALTPTLSASVSIAPIGFPVNFTTTVSGGTAPYVETYLWGDGSYGYNSTLTNTHEYRAPGTYCPAVEVVDQASPPNGGTATSACITVPSPGNTLVAAFSPSPSSGSSPLWVNFTSSVHGGSSPYTYRWSYGDGSAASAAANPLHIYNKTGTFQVNLTVTDSASRTAHAYGNVTVASLAPVSVTISGNPTSGAPPLSVGFVSTVTGGRPGYTYAWTFGDGGTSVLASPTHVYSAVGTYPASVVVTDSQGRTATSNTVSVSVSTFPTLSATAGVTPTTGVSPLNVAFNGSAAGGEPAYAFSWNFGDGTAASSARNPSHTYASAGAYTATLTVTDQQPRTATSTVHVQVVAPLTGQASASPTSGTAPLQVTFNATATGGAPAYSWDWRFGDGLASTAENPSHSYSNGGTFTAEIWVNDSIGDSWTRSITVSVVAATPLTVSICGWHAAIVGTPVEFCAVAAGGVAPYAFSWDFGDGTGAVNTGATNFSTHSFASVGKYSVVVTVTDTASHTATSSALTVYASTGGISVVIGGAVLLPVDQTASYWAAASGGAGGYTYTWTFGDGTSSAASSSNTTTHLFSTTGKFDVSVTVKDAAGTQQSSNVLVVTVSPASTTPAPAPNPFFSGGSLSALGWGVLLAAIAVVVIAVVLLARRRPRPEDEWQPGPGSGWAPPPG